MLKINDVAPDISLSDQDGKIHSLSDYNGNKLLVYFYPRADTPGCTRQSCAVSEAKLQFAELNVSAIGISPDVPESQKKFDEKFVNELKLNMPDMVYVYSQNSASSFLNFIKIYQTENVWMNTNLMCIGEKTSSILNEIKWKKIFLFNPGEEEFLLYKI